VNVRPATCKYSSFQIFKFSNSDGGSKQTIVRGRMVRREKSDNDKGVVRLLEEQVRGHYGVRAADWLHDDC
jgi:hypothetical protein